jgi:hypothetical protein
MRTSTRLSLVSLLGLSGALPACGSPAGTTIADAGTQTTPVTITFAPNAPTVANLTLMTATMTLSHVHVLGDTPPSGPPPGPKPMEMDSVTFDAIVAGGSLTLTPPPGLYSRVQFTVENVMLAGTWDGTPFTAHLATFQGPRVDLRAATAVEVVSGADAGVVAFTVAVDPASWFAAPSPLDGLMPDMTTNTISCDDMTNAAAAMTLTTRIGQSFSLR